MKLAERKDLALERQFGPEEVIRAKAVGKRPVQQEMFRRPQRVVNPREQRFQQFQAEVTQAARRLVRDLESEESA